MGVPEGEYRIFNRILDPIGLELAITFNGENKALTLTPRSSSDAQRWIIRNHDTHTASLTPFKADNLQATWGSGFVTVLPGQSYVWNISWTSAGYVIQDVDKTVYWGATKAEYDETVNIGVGNGDEKQSWIFKKLE